MWDDSQNFEFILHREILHFTVVAKNVVHYIFAIPIVSRDFRREKENPPHLKVTHHRSCLSGTVHDWVVKHS